MLYLAKALSKYNGEIFNNWIIAKAEYSLFLNDNSIKYNAIINKHTKSYSLLSSFSYNKNNTITKELKVFLLKLLPYNKTKYYVNENYIWNKNTSTSFTQDNINDFLSLVNDTNELHRNTQSIVPGLQIFNYVLSNLNCKKNIKKAEIKFLSPLYVNEEFCYVRDTNEILGFTNDKVIFSIKLI